MDSRQLVPEEVPAPTTPGAELSLLLRSWWEQAPGTPPTQTALARRAGVNQATMSRYLNPARPATAPPHVVRVLHAALGAAPASLEEALRLSGRAQEAGRPGRADGPVVPGRAVHGLPATEPPPQAACPADLAEPPPSRAHSCGAPSSWPWFLGVVAVVLAVAATVVVTEKWLRPPAAPVTAAASAGGPPSWPVVRLGDVLWEARTVQYLLEARGYRVEVTGTVDAVTESQIKTFQGDRGLVPDGRVGPLTWPRLVMPVKEGGSGPAVTALQALLTGAGHPTAVTGTFTTDMTDTLRIFRAEHGLPATGPVDPLLWQTVMNAQHERLHG
ncbi:peptidoglycan-binding domain-containing protein [Streptomyces mutomycini]|uniref:peptidoglycan-binding domain-containing protein n=1 Tax=Streptomyces mutomycini TaxID=284036 RepID=UPI0033F714F0